MATTEMIVQLSGLGKQKIAALSRKAKRLGVSPDVYVTNLVEEDLALDRTVKNTTIREIMGPGRDIDETELDAFVEKVDREHDVHAPFRQVPQGLVPVVVGRVGPDRRR